VSDNDRYNTAGHTWEETSHGPDGIHFRCRTCGLLAICNALFTPEQQRQWLAGVPVPCRSGSGDPPTEPQPSPTSDDLPSFKDCAKRYSKAVRRWIRFGRPVRSAERVQEIFETICGPCPDFNAKKKRCRVCGCRTSSGNIALINKIKMATERCPKNKFLAEVKPPRKKK